VTDAPGSTASTGLARLAGLIRDVPDFPTPGIVFKDLAPLLADGHGLRAAAELLADRVAVTGATVIAGIEARGFLLGAPAAVLAGVGFVPIRKAGKLPGAVHARTYALEYGEATLEVQADAPVSGARVLLVDDVLATGGTAAAAAALVRLAGGDPVELAVLLELISLGGRARCAPLPVHALLAG